MELKEINEAGEVVGPVSEKENLEFKNMGVPESILKHIARHGKIITRLLKTAEDHKLKYQNILQAIRFHKDCIETALREHGQARFVKPKEVPHDTQGNSPEALPSTAGPDSSSNEDHSNVEKPKTGDHPKSVSEKITMA